MPSKWMTDSLSYTWPPAAWGGQQKEWVILTWRFHVLPFLWPCWIWVPSLEALFAFPQFSRVVSAVLSANVSAEKNSPILNQNYSRLLKPEQAVTQDRFPSFSFCSNKYWLIACQSWGEGGALSSKHTARCPSRITETESIKLISMIFTTIRRAHK